MCERRVVSLLFSLAHSRTVAWMTADGTLSLEVGGTVRTRQRWLTGTDDLASGGEQGFQTLIRMTLGLGAGEEGVEQKIGRNTEGRAIIGDKLSVQKLEKNSNEW